jgi:hypothetical protein
MTTTSLSCSCGTVKLDVEDDPIDRVECCCSTCRAAAEIFTQLPGAPDFLTEHGTTPYVPYRKDRVTIVSGADQLRQHRLTPDAGTRRFVAGCCSTPVFLEFKGGHWLSLYSALWPERTRPAPRIRSMAASLDDRSILPAGIPDSKWHTLTFYARLAVAWVEMGFRVPKVDEHPPLEV